MEVPAGVRVLLNGLDLTDRVAGPGYAVRELEGWWEPTASTGSVVQRAGAPGGWLDEAHPMGRRLVARGSIDSGSHAESAAMLDALWRALPVDGRAPLVVVEDGIASHVMVRQEDKPDITWVTDTYVTFDFQLHSREWRRLAGDGSGPSRSVTVGLPFTQGGRRRPYVLPSRIDGVAVSGLVELVNMGSAPPPVVVTFTGPVSRPSVRSEVTGRSQWFDLDVLPGQSLVVDQDARTVRLNGVSRRGAMRGEWLAPVPGDRLVFDAGSFVEAARMTVSWSDSWK